MKSLLSCRNPICACSHSWGFGVVSKAVQESVTACVKAMLTECHSPGVLRAATLALINSKKGGCAADILRLIELGLGAGGQL